MFYEEVLKGGILITRTQSAYTGQLESLQRIVFPFLAENELLHAGQYKRHLQVFPEGQFIALDGEQVVGATTTMRCFFNRSHPRHHTFSEVMGGGWLTTHDPQGDWLYGIDVSVHPGYRKRGIAKGLYRARQYTCRQLALKGQVTVGMLNGYEKFRDHLSIEAYFEKVKSGELFDRTVSVQQKIGFEIVSLNFEYLHDPTCGNAGAVIVLDANKEV